MSIETLPSRTQSAELCINGRTFRYGEMVAALFKPMPTQADRMMHAAIGIAGERREMYAATHRENILEEAGDIEFYIEALLLSSEFLREAVVEMAKDGSIYDIVCEGLTLNTVFDIMDDASTNILDLCKKMWVYNKPMCADVQTSLAQSVVELWVCLDFVYRMWALAEGHFYVQQENAKKLVGTGGRFESFCYSDDAANARADKVDAQSTLG